MATWIRELIGEGVADCFAKCRSGACFATAKARRGALVVMMIAAALALLILPAGCSKEQSADHSYGLIAQLTTTSQFGELVLQADRSVLVEFYATWCPPCKLLAPILESLSSEYKDRVQFVKIDGDRFPKLLRAYNVPGYPTVLLFISGKPVKMLDGLRPTDEYRTALDAALKISPPLRKKSESMTYSG